MKTILWVCAMSLSLALPFPQACAQDAATSADGPRPSIAQLDADAAQARRRVTEIVNQPITHLARTGEPTLFSPGWFHAGAIKPDFNTVDVRSSQEFPYANAVYVTSDLNPSEMFLGRELEFNAMTKYFYVDRTLPKRRLSQAEMVEINRLYRIIGRADAASKTRRSYTTPLLIALCMGSALFLALAILLARRDLRAARIRLRG